MAEASEITVKLTDRREFDAKVLGVDKRTDIAVLKIDAKNLPAVKIGHASELKVGEWVAAIGSPFGFENTITSGIVSAKARALPDENYVPFIQTDVAVNPGNSGGPLFNMDGEVVGVNSQIFSRTGGFMGLSFAIPIDVAIQVKDDLVQNGKVTRGRIGVQIQDVNQALANSFGLPKPQGALISSVEPGSPAEKAGLKSGDVVLGVNGKEINRLSELSGAIAATKPGNNARLQVWREGKSRDVDVKVAELMEQKVAMSNGGDSQTSAKLGLTVRELAPDERAQLKTEGGLVVQNASGAAARAGIQTGRRDPGVQRHAVEVGRATEDPDEENGQDNCPSDSAGCKPDVRAGPSRLSGFARSKKGGLPTGSPFFCFSQPSHASPHARSNNRKHSLPGPKKVNTFL